MQKKPSESLGSLLHHGLAGLGLLVCLLVSGVPSRVLSLPHPDFLQVTERDFTALRHLSHLRQAQQIAQANHEPHSDEEIEKVLGRILDLNRDGIVDSLDLEIAQGAFSYLRQHILSKLPAEHSLELLSRLNELESDSLRQLEAVSHSKPPGSFRDLS